ncbi:YceI family protein [Caldiplasma sukawensis]
MEKEIQKVWKSDIAHSEIEFRARHMMISTVKGYFTDFEITVVGDESNAENASVEVKIKAASVNTRDKDRDNHLRSSDFFESEKFPDIKFKSNKIEKTGENTYNIYGDLTIKDVTKPIVVKGEVEGIIKDPYGNMRAGIVAEGSLTREEFGLKWNVILEAGKVMVGSKISFTVRSEMVLQSQ